MQNMNLEITNFKMDPLEVVPDSWTYDSVDKIDHIDAPITYQEFFAKYLLHNRPCVLGMWATSHWKSTQKWSCDDGTPDWDYLLQNFGESPGIIANNVFCPVLFVKRPIGLTLYARRRKRTPPPHTQVVQLKASDAWMPAQPCRSLWITH